MTYLIMTTVLHYFWSVRIMSCFLTQQSTDWYNDLSVVLHKSHVTQQQYKKTISFRNKCFCLPQTSTYVNYSICQLLNVFHCNYCKTAICNCNSNTKYTLTLFKNHMPFQIDIYCMPKARYFVSCAHIHSHRLLPRQGGERLPCGLERLQCKMHR